MTNRSQDLRSAEALQEALERQEALLAKGVDPAKARARAARELGGEAAALFALTGALAESAAPIPDAKHVDVFAERLRRVATQKERRGDAVRRKVRARLRWWQLPGFGTAAAAAAIAIFAGVLVPAFRSLPGDSLYSIKRASESARLGVVSGSGEARLRLRLAAERFDEVEGLVERAQISKVGPGLAAAPAAQNITDPHIVELIEKTLSEAREQIEVAATILIAEPPDVQSLDDLVQVSQRGQQLAEDVAEDLPAAVKPPVLSTVVTLAKIEAEAKAKRTEVVAASPEPQPCETPEPTPSATPPATDEVDESAEPTPSAEPTATPEPTVSPEPTPCVTPEPTVEPTPSPTPTPSPFLTPSPSPTPTPTPTAEQRRRRAESNPGSEPAPTPTGRAFWA